MNAFIALGLLLSTDVAAEALAAPREEGFVAVIPVFGATDVPTNPLILVRDDFGFSELRIVDDGAAIAESTSSTATGHFTSLLRVIATDPLRPDTGHRLIDVFENEEQREVTTFSTGAGPDDDAPAAPDVTADGNVLSISSDETIEVVSVSQNGAAAYFDVLRDGAITVDGQGVNIFSISALDRAGNSSPPVDVETNLGQPPFFAGCASTPTTSLLVLVALLALLHRKKSAVAAVVVVAGLHAAPADACSFEEGFVATLPADGDVVPSNPLILVRDSEGGDPRLFDSDGVEVPTAASPFNARFTSGVRLIPREPLDVDATYTIEVVTSVNDDGVEDRQVLSTLTTVEADDRSPATPDVEVVQISNPPGQQDAICSSNGFATLLVESDEPIAVVDVVTSGRGRIFDLLDEDGVLTVEGVGPTTIGVVVFDHAGNPSPPVNVEIDFGQPPLGCGGCPGGSNDVVVGLGFPLFGLLRLRRRRRQR